MRSGLSPNVVKTALDKVFMSEYEYSGLPGLATAENGTIFRQDTTDRAAVIIEQFMGTGYFEARGEEQDVPAGQFKVGNQKTFSVVNYDKSLDISKNYFDDDQHSTVEKAIRDMGRTARLTRDKKAFEKFNLGFTTVLSNDGVALFADAHVTLSGATVDNLTTGALSETNLPPAFNALMKQKTQDGTLGGFEPAVLLVPTDLFKTANEICKSELRQGTANNDLNYFSSLFPGLQIFHSPFLSAAEGGSDTAWFLLSRNHSMYRWVRNGLQTALIDWKYQRNNNYVYKAGYREVIGPISYEGLYASTGAA